MMLQHKILALKANDKGTDPEALVRDIYKAVSQMKDQLPRDILLLIEQFVSFYINISIHILSAFFIELTQTAKCFCGAVSSHD
jgi:ABC-type branched-subunit amino acid transport system ATPase component